MYAQITKDLLYDGNYIKVNRKHEVIFGGGPHQVGPLMKVRLLDDDRELYYEAVSDDEALEDLFSWAMRESGVTILQVWKSPGKWVDEIS